MHVYAVLIFNNIHLLDSFINSVLGLLQTLHWFVNDSLDSVSAMQIRIVNNLLILYQ